MAECLLGKVVIIDVDIALKGILQVLPGAAAVRRQDRAEAAVNALHPALGLRINEAQPRRPRSEARRPTSAAATGWASLTVLRGVLNRFIDLRQTMGHCHHQ